MRKHVRSRYVTIDVDLADFDLDESDVIELAKDFDLEVVKKDPLSDGCTPYDDTADRLVAAIEQHIFTPFEMDRLERAVAAARVWGRRKAG